MKREIHSFPTMYIMGGCKWGRNGSKERFSEKKWSKNSFSEGQKFGSTDFGGSQTHIFEAIAKFSMCFEKFGTLSSK